MAQIDVELTPGSPGGAPAAGAVGASDGILMIQSGQLVIATPAQAAVYVNDLLTAGASAGLNTFAEVETALGLKAPLASPALTGSPTAPTPSIGDNDTSLATTAFIRTERADLTAPTILRDEFTIASTESGEIGELGWGFTNGTWNLVPPEANHPGICRRASTAVSGTVASCFFGGGGTATILRWDQTEEQNWIVRPLTTDADYDIRVGVFSDGTANPPSNGIYFERLSADTSWHGVTRASASQTRSAALAAFASDWFKLRIRRVDATTVGFTINGGTEVTQTGNVFGGTTALVIGIQIIPTSTNARSVDVDAFSHVIPAMTR